MKKTTVIVLIGLLTGCQSFKNFTAQKVNLIEGQSQKFTLPDNRFYTDLYVNNVKGTFLFDTGAMLSVITDADFLKHFTLTKDNYYNSIRLKSATGNAVESNKFITDSIRSSIFNGTKNIFGHVVVQNNKASCQTTDMSKVGIIGIDLLKLAGQPILLDFENQKITVLAPGYSAAGYVKLNARVPTGLASSITVPLKIDGKEINFTLDTGNTMGLLLKSESNNLDSSKRFCTVKMLLGSFDKVSVASMQFYENVKVESGAGINETTVVTSLPNITKNLIGVSFMKHFNWILDFNTGALYIKKIIPFDQGAIAKVTGYGLKFAAIDGKLLVSLKNETSAVHLMAGDQVIAVNGEPVNAGNICHFQEVLNQSEHPEAMNLEVLSPTN